MGRPRGYSVITDPDRPLAEADTVTCCHCQRVIFLKPGFGPSVYRVYDRTLKQWTEEAGAMCARCNAPVCLPCHDAGVCTPWEQQMERIEARDRMLRSVGV